MTLYRKRYGTVDQKADYVRNQPQTRNHHCHWPGCDRQVPPAMWGCKAHWFRLPRALRNKIWAAYQPGQETNMTPSKAYLAAAREVQEWCANERVRAFNEGVDSVSPPPAAEPQEEPT